MTFSHYHDNRGLYETARKTLANNEKHMRERGKNTWEREGEKIRFPGTLLRPIRIMRHHTNSMKFVCLPVCFFVMCLCICVWKCICVCFHVYVCTCLFERHVRLLGTYFWHVQTFRAARLCHTENHSIFLFVYILVCRK